MEQANCFAKVPEFLAAFNNILKNGFFEFVQLRVHKSSMPIGYIQLEGEGIILDNPSLAEERGAGCFYDPESMIEKVKLFMDNSLVRIKTVRCSVSSDPWTEESYQVGERSDHIDLVGTKIRFKFELYYCAL